MGRLRSRRPAKERVKVAGMCWAITIGTASGAPRSIRIFSSAGGPPAEAPTTTTSIAAVPAPGPPRAPSREPVLVCICGRFLLRQEASRRGGGEESAAAGSCRRRRRAGRRRSSDAGAGGGGGAGGREGRGERRGGR